MTARCRRRGFRLETRGKINLATKIIEPVVHRYRNTRTAMQAELNENRAWFPGLGQEAAIELSDVAADGKRCSQSRDRILKAAITASPIVLITTP